MAAVRAPRFSGLLAPSIAAATMTALLAMASVRRGVFVNPDGWSKVCDS